MAHQVQVYLLGDQTFDVNAKLRQLLLIVENPVLVAFFEQSYVAIQAEIGRLHFHERKSFPRFANIAELLAKPDLSAAFQTPLTCIYQLASFIRYISPPDKS
jgi:hypothetical protein